MEAESRPGFARGPCPVQARAPNSRSGLTDETVPGADPFISSPRRQTSRLSKVPPLTSPRSAHTRTRSSRSSTSMRSTADSFGYAGSEMELQLSPRGSQDQTFGSSRGHSRIYSSSSIPPQVPRGNDGLVGALSPRPTFCESGGSDIGRAIG